MSSSTEYNYLGQWGAHGFLPIVTWLSWPPGAHIFSLLGLSRGELLPRSSQRHITHRLDPGNGDQESGSTTRYHYTGLWGAHGNLLSVPPLPFWLWYFSPF